MYWENQPELPSDKGSNRSWGASRDFGRGPFKCGSSFHGRSNGLHNVYAIMFGWGPDPLKNKKVFAGSDYLTASASRRYFNLGGYTRPREMD